MLSLTTPTASSQSTVAKGASPFIHRVAPTSLSSLPPPPPPPLYAPFAPPSAAPAPSPLTAFAAVPSPARPWSTVAALAPRSAPAPATFVAHAPVFVAPRPISLPRVHSLPGTSVLTLAAARAALVNPSSVTSATLAQAKTFATTVEPPSDLTLASASPSPSPRLSLPTPSLQTLPMEHSPLSPPLNLPFAAAPNSPPPCSCLMSSFRESVAGPMSTSSSQPPRPFFSSPPTSVWSTRTLLSTPPLSRPLPPLSTPPPPPALHAA